jgi:hypothetical protein
MRLELMPYAKRFMQYDESDDNFWFQLRLTFQWDEGKYKEMMEIVQGMLGEYQNEDVFPKPGIYFFTSTVDFIVGIISNPLFSVNPPLGFTQEGYKEFLNSRKAELMNLKDNFLGGEL